MQCEHAAHAAKLEEEESAKARRQQQKAAACDALQAKLDAAAREEETVKGHAHEEEATKKQEEEGMKEVLREEEARKTAARIQMRVDMQRVGKVVEGAERLCREEEAAKARGRQSTRWRDVANLTLLDDESRRLAEADEALKLKREEEESSKATRERLQRALPLLVRVPPEHVPEVMPSAPLTVAAVPHIEAPATAPDPTDATPWMPAGAAADDTIETAGPGDTSTQNHLDDEAFMMPGLVRTIRNMQTDMDALVAMNELTLLEAEWDNIRGIQPEPQEKRSKNELSQERARDWCRSMAPTLPCKLGGNMDVVAEIISYVGSFSKRELGRSEHTCFGCLQQLNMQQAPMGSCRGPLGRRQMFFVHARRKLKHLPCRCGVMHCDECRTEGFANDDHRKYVDYGNGRVKRGRNQFKKTCFDCGSFACCGAKKGFRFLDTCRQCCKVVCNRCCDIEAPSSPTLRHLCTVICKRCVSSLQIRDLLRF